MARLCLSGRGAPLRHGSAELRARVTLLPRDTLEAGREVRRVRVAESGVRSFEVQWSEGADGTTIASNPSGGNKVAWSVDRMKFWLSPARDPHLSSVHVRFVLRHVTTALLAHDLSAWPVHAVVGSLADGGVLAVCGPTRSGKTRLVNRLIVSGLLDRVIDDDCPLLAAGARLHSVVPARYEVTRASSHRLAGLVLLDDATTAPRVVAPGEAAEVLRRTQRPWPASWLPHDEDSEPDIRLPDNLPVLALPVHDDGEADHRAVTERLAHRLAESAASTVAQPVDGAGEVGQGRGARHRSVGERHAELVLDVSDEDEQIQRVDA